MSMDVSLIVRANAAQAKQELASTAAELKKLSGANEQTAAVVKAAADTETKARTSAATAARQEAMAVVAAARQKEQEAAKAAAAAAKAAQQEAAARQAAAAAYAGLRASLDPIYASSMRYEQAVETLDAAVKAGAISQEQANRVLLMAGDAYLKVGGAGTKGAGGMSAMAYKGRMVAQQLGQVAQQGSVTGNYLQAMAIQFPDIAMGFGMMGGAAEGTTVAIMGTEVAVSTLLPLVALIASVTFPLMINAMGGGKSAADQMRASNNDLGSSISALSGIANRSLEDLRRKYGEVDATLLTLLGHQREEEIQVAQTSARNAIKALADEYGVASGQMNFFRITGKGAAADVAQSLGLTKEAFIGLQEAIKAAQSAKTFEEQAAALARVDGYLQRSAISGGDLAKGVTDSALALREVKTQADGSEKALEGASVAATALATINPQFGWLDNAITKAGALAGNLWNAAAAAAANRTATMDPTSAGFLATQYGAYGQGHKAMDASTDPLYNPPPIPKTLRTAGSSGAGSANEVKAYIDSLRQESEMLRTLDPVQQELLKHRDLLSKATGAEREEIEKLVAAQQQEVNLGDAMNAFGQATYDALSGLILQGKSASDVMKGLEKAILQAALQALVLGEGPLSGIFGTKGTSLIGLIAGGLGFADGGMIYGAGGARDDKVMSFTSPGEFIVNGRATAANRGLLEFINGGGQFASGGMVGGAPQVMISNATAAPPIAIHIDARGAQMGVADQIAATLRDMAPRFGQLAVEAVRNARQRGVAI